jgi:hypothetical protein
MDAERFERKFYEGRLFRFSCVEILHKLVRSSNLATCDVVKWMVKTVTMVMTMVMANNGTAFCCRYQ